MAKSQVMNPNYSEGYYSNGQYYYQPHYDPNYGMLPPGSHPADGYYSNWQHQQSWPGYGMYDSGYEYYGPTQGYGYMPQGGESSDFNGGQARVGGSRSKHSYSSNRNRNRQFRSDLRTEQLETGTLSTISTVESTGDIDQRYTEGVKDITGLDTTNEKGDDVNVSNYHVGNSSRNFDRGRNRGNRILGSDSRTKEYDRSKQAGDRRRGYNRNSSYNVNNNSDTRQHDKSGKGDSQQGNDTDERTDHSDRGGRGGRNKSYRDSRQRVNREERNWKNNKENKPSSAGSDDSDMKKAAQNENQLDSRKQAADESAMAEDKTTGEAGSDKEKSGGARKKKREVQVFTSSGHREIRDWQGGAKQSSQRSSYDRYNFRGQDYNKRHKEEGLERGGDRSKLSDAAPGVEEACREEDAEGDCEVSNVAKFAGKRSADNTGKRSTRFKAKGKLDESQRGVLIEQLTKSSYECMVCYESVRSQNAVWSCGNCYHIFHLRCIKRWARSPNAVVSGADKDGWRCPACQNLTFKFPNQYRCFCGKVRDPEVVRMEIPHSCGDVCQRDRGDGCKHPCNILCHPGPCPECQATVTKSCDCGKTRQTAKCSQSTVIKCDAVCERQLNCGKHFCSARCHSGSCEKCEVTLTQVCYGKHAQREVVCGSEESFNESYSCAVICGRVLDCGNHTCEEPCHPGDCTSCPMLPSNVTHCPCGAHTLKDLSAELRTSCLDPIPTCTGVCNKPLSCGPQVKHHQCKKTCHEGECGQCSGKTVLTCRCLFMDKEFLCSEIKQVTDESGTFTCDKRCNRKKQCGRHKCGQNCCTKEEHMCELVCGRKLPCGLHKCEEPCHRNNCPPCLMAGFDELTCHCGAEVLYPPIPCGTLPPECHRPCTRPHSCQHPVRHSCHSEDHCPPCTELTKKMCMGNHVLRANIPCHLTDISCGMKCSKPLPCGEHKCNKTCHKGPCLEDGQACVQPCQRKRELCDHTCGAPCHGEQPCPALPCKAMLQIKCGCGLRTADVQCCVGSVSMDTAEYQKITMQNLKDSLQGVMGAASVNISKFNQSKIGQGRVLECNEQCALLDRNRRLALALEIHNPDLSAKLGSPTYTDFLKDFAKKDAHFVASIEKALSDLVQSAKQSKQVSRSHAFQSMNQNQRRAVHELAEFYGCQTMSYDYEPKKNVVATAQKDKCWLPSVTLTCLVQRELHPRAPPPIPHVHREETLRQTNQATKQSTSVIGEAGTLAEGWQVIGKKTKKSSTATTPAPKSAIATIDKIEGNLEKLCSSGSINYSSLSEESKAALKAEPVVDYFDFTVN